MNILTEKEIKELITKTKLSKVEVENTIHALKKIKFWAEEQVLSRLEIGICGHFLIFSEEREFFRFLSNEKVLHRWPYYSGDRFYPIKPKGKGCNPSANYVLDASYKTLWKGEGLYFRKKLIDFWVRVSEEVLQYLTEMKIDNKKKKTNKLTEKELNSIFFTYNASAEEIRKAIETMKFLKKDIEEEKLRYPEAGICFNFTTLYDNKNILDLLKNYSVLEKWSYFSGNAVYPIKSSIEGMYPGEFYDFSRKENTLWKCESYWYRIRLINFWVEVLKEFLDYKLKLGNNS